MKHVFTDKMSKCPELVESLVSGSTVKEYMKALRKMSSSDDAIRIWEADDYEKFNYYDDTVDNKVSWTCFGFGTEVLVATYLTMFGPTDHNLQFDKSIEDIDCNEVDRGIDHFGTSIKEMVIRKSRTDVKKGSPVYIQTKGTTNHSKEHKTNDGSRITNFLAVAQTEARNVGAAYNARYILVTLGKGLHYKLENNTSSIIEVINYKKLSKMIDNNTVFWNRLRREFGLSELAYTPPVDPEYAVILNKLEHEEGI